MGKRAAGAGAGVGAGKRAAGGPNAVVPGRPGGSGEANLEGQVGLGIDVVKIERMARILERTPSFAEKCFSPEERAYCDKKAVPASHYATRFAAKEAVLKALGTGFAEGVGRRDVEVRRTSKGRPYVVLTGRAKEIAAEKGIRELPISLSYTHDEAVACAMALKGEPEQERLRREDPMAQLSQQFKDARSFLDEI